MMPARLAVWTMVLAASSTVGASRIVGGPERAALQPAPAPSTDHVQREFVAEADGEAIATIHASCASCEWGEAGREAAVLRVALDGGYSQHLALVLGAKGASYTIALGPVAKGRHTLSLDRDSELSAAGAGAATIGAADVAVVRGDSGRSDLTALAMAPIVYARPNTVGKFTDLPLLMWYEIEPTGRGQHYRYSVIFSNEDGGTQTDRLMATWGRTTDIEFVYGVEIDAAGRVLAEEFQGPGHEVPAFKGRHEGRHPLLWVSTDNNMVSESGPTRIRYRLVPQKFDLTHQSREAVMDANPWIYAMASAEMRREGKVADEPPAGINKIPDPRRFVFVEACGTVGNAAVAVSVGSNQSQSAGSVARVVWTASDRGLPQYRVGRDGCFTIATPLPAGTHRTDVRAVRVQAFQRAPGRGEQAVTPNPVTITRINKVFMLDEHDLPGPSLLAWEGSRTIRAGGEPLEVKVP